MELTNKPHNKFIRLIKSFFQKILISLCALILSFTLPIFLLVFFLPMWIIRSSVKLLGKMIRPDLSMLNYASNTCVNINGSENHPRTIFLVEFQFPQDLDFELIISTFNTRAVEKTDEKKTRLKYPELKQYLTSWLGFQFWKNDPHFNIRNHIKLLNRGIQIPTTSQDLREFEEKLLSKPFCPRRSPWEILVIPNMQLQNELTTKTVIIFRCSHIMADGYSVKKLLEEASHVEYSTKLKINYPKKGFFEVLLFPFKFCYTIAQMNLLSFKDFPFKQREQDKSLQDCLQSSDVISIESILKLKQLHQISFTAVVFGIAAGALREMALRNGIKMGDFVPCVIPLPKPGHPDKLRNHFTLAVMELPIGEQDPKLRLKKCHKELKRLRTSVYPAVTNFFITLYGTCFNWIGRKIGVNNFAAVNVSYVPSGLDKCSFTGVEIIGQTFCIGVQRGSIGAVITVSSYKDRIQFHTIIDSSVIPKGKVLEFKEIINHEVENLLNENVLDAPFV